MNKVCHCLNLSKSFTKTCLTKRYTWMALDPDEILIDLIFSAMNQEAPFEIAPITELITGLTSDVFRKTAAVNFCSKITWNPSCQKTAFMPCYGWPRRKA